MNEEIQTAFDTAARKGSYTLEFIDLVSAIYFRHQANRWRRKYRQAHADTGSSGTYDFIQIRLDESTLFFIDTLKGTSQ